MILFWAICALSLIVALTFILPSLLDRKSDRMAETEDERRNANIAVYRDQLTELGSDLKNGLIGEAQFEQDREEIERRLLEDTVVSEPKPKTLPLQSDRRTAYALGLAIPLVAVIFYYKVGEPNGIAMTPAAAPQANTIGQMSGQRSQQQIEANVTALAKRLQSNPADAQGWITLARSYNSMERFGEAAGAYAKATELNPNDAELWAEYAFVSAMANKQQLEGRPTDLIEQALKVDPENPKALQLAGTAAYQAKNYKKAIEYWQRVLARVPADSEVGQLIKARIDEAKSLAAAPGK
jgi:cytochrome c-type biogenesis protein CcmH